MRFRYQYDDLDCDLCNDMVDAGCPHTLCPHIMENLDDLRHDPAFIDAVDDVDAMLPYHTPTLMYLHNIGFPDERALKIAPPPEPYNHGIKPECSGCQYPRVGVSCHGSDGSCVKTDYNEIIERGRMPCPA